MKRLLTPLFLILLSCCVFSVTTKSVVLGHHESVVVAGRNITLSSASDEKVILEVDGEYSVFYVGGNDTKSGVAVDVGLIYEPNKYRNLSVELTIKVYYACGNGKCEVGETSSSCCTDCNCSSAKAVCYDNRCLVSDFVKCFSDAGCDDGDPCTVDSCGGYSVIGCNHTLVSSCVANDSCCPAGCGYDDDPDCASRDLELKSTLSRECQNDAVCDDKDDSTVDRCDIMAGLCYYYAAPVKHVAGEFADVSGTASFADPSSVNSSSADSSSENVFDDVGRPCRMDSDCDDMDAATADICDEVGRLCYHVPVSEADAINAITGAVVVDADPEKKGFFSKIIDWIIGLF